MQFAANRPVMVLREMGRDGKYQVEPLHEHTSQAQLNLLHQAYWNAL